MKTYKGTSSKTRMWLAALALTGAVVGCGDGGDSGGGGSGSAPSSDPNWTVQPGAGTGAAGLGRGPAVVNLGMAGNYAILAESLISTTGVTTVTGDLGMSPAAASFVQGFGLTLDGTGCFSTSSLVTGKVYAADYNTGGCPTPANLTTAVGDKGAAYTDANSRAPDYTELGAGTIGGMTLPPAVYKWSSGVLIPTNLVLSGGPNDVWIFQIAGDLTAASAVRVTLAGGALAKNIFWATFGVADFGTTSHFEGIVLSQTLINLRTGASANGRLLAGTEVTLDANAVVQP